MRGVGRKSAASVSIRFHVKAILLTASPKHASPDTDGVGSECLECQKVRWHCVIGKEAGDDLPLRTAKNSEPILSRSHWLTSQGLRP